MTFEFQGRTYCAAGRFLDEGGRLVHETTVWSDAGHEWTGRVPGGVVSAVRTWLSWQEDAAYWAAFAEDQLAEDFGCPGCGSLGVHGCRPGCPVS
jgi:hypothetical protein